MGEVVELDSHRVAPYVASAIDGFLNDPPDTDFQRGFLAALIAVYKEGLGRRPHDVRLIAAERL